MNNITKRLSVLLTALMVSFSTSVYSFEGFSVGAIFSTMDFSTTGNKNTITADVDTEETRIGIGYNF